MTNIIKISDTVKRIYFKSDDSAIYDTQYLGAYIKLLFHPGGTTDLALLTSPAKPIMRTYTISEIRDSEFAVDFVMHELSPPTQISGGYGAYWAHTTYVGDNIQMAGPGISQPVNFNTNQTLLIADLTSLPALYHASKGLPNNATGNLFLINSDVTFIPSISLPDGIAITVF